MRYEYWFGFYSSLNQADEEVNVKAAEGWELFQMSAVPGYTNEEGYGYGGIYICLRRPLAAKEEHGDH